MTRIIYCESVEQMIDICMMLTTKGFTFIAKAETMTIQLFGGY